VLSAGGVRLVDSGCLQMAGGEMRGCFRVGRSCRLFLSCRRPRLQMRMWLGWGSSSQLSTRASQRPAHDLCESLKLKVEIQVAVG
jgi:hypothetical protein